LVTARGAEGAAEQEEQCPVESVHAVCNSKREANATSARSR